MGIILTLAAPDDCFLFFDARFHEANFGIGETMLFVRGTNEGAVIDVVTTNGVRGLMWGVASCAMRRFLCYFKNPS